jgi:hypothetical protein
MPLTHGGAQGRNGRPRIDTIHQIAEHIPPGNNRPRGSSDTVAARSPGQRLSPGSPHARDYAGDGVRRSATGAAAGVVSGPAAWRASSA